MRAITWPFVTGVLQSAWMSFTCPEICEPTCTVVTAFSVPLAATAAARGPRSTFARRYFTSPSPARDCHQYQPPPAAAARATSTRSSFNVAFTALAAEYARLASGLALQAQLAERHAAVDRLDHVVDGEQPDRGGGQRLHLDAGRTAAFHARADDDRGGLARE